MRTHYVLCIIFRHSVSCDAIVFYIFCNNIFSQSFKSVLVHIQTWKLSQIKPRYVINDLEPALDRQTLPYFVTFRRSYEGTSGFSVNFGTV